MCKVGLGGYVDPLEDPMARFSTRLLAFAALAFLMGTRDAEAKKKKKRKKRKGPPPTGWIVEDDGQPRATTRRSGTRSLRSTDA